MFNGKDMFNEEISLIIPGEMSLDMFYNSITRHCKLLWWIEAELSNSKSLSKVLRLFACVINKHLLCTTVLLPYFNWFTTTVFPLISAPGAY